MAIDIDKITYNDLDKSQQQVVKAIVGSNQNLFIQGRAGTGKSAIIRVAKRICQKKGKKLILLSSTGLAAENIGGVTIHSQFMLAPTHVFKKERYKQYNDALCSVDAIIIDEISMVTPDLFELIDHLCRLAKAGADENNENKPFGGIQMILVGDLYQLEPFHSVDDEDPAKVRKQTELDEYLSNFNDERYMHKDKKGNKVYDEPYFFNTDIYKEANFETIELTRVHRQADDKGDFLDNLYRVSRGTEIAKALTYFNKNCFAKGNIGQDNDDTVIITTTNKIVKAENERAKHGHKLKEYPVPRGWVSDNYIEQLRNNLTRKGESESAIDKMLEQIKRMRPPRPFDEKIELFEGAKVMFCKNNRGEGYVNGTMGVVQRFVKNLDPMTNGKIPEIPVVKITTKGDKCGAEIIVKPIDLQNIIYMLNDKNQIVMQPIGKITQIPLTLAYAFTVHKAQGQTLDSVCIKPADKFWAYGQLYVALSRVKKLSGLHLYRELTSDDVHVSGRVKDFLSTGENKFNAPDDADIVIEDDLDPDGSLVYDDKNIMPINDGIIAKLQKLETVVLGALEQIKELKTLLIDQRVTQENTAASDNILSADNETLAENHIDSVPASGENGTNDLDAQIEKIFNKYQLSNDLYGHYSVLPDFGERRRVLKLTMQFFNTRDTDIKNQINEVYRKNKAIYLDEAKARSFINDYEDRQKVISLIEQRDNIDVPDTRMILWDAGSVKLTKELSEQFKKYVGNKGSNRWKILAAYFICRDKCVGRPIKRADIFNLCQQDGSLHLDTDDFNDTFNEMKGMVKTSQKIIFDNNPTNSDGIWFSTTVLDNLLTNMKQAGCFDVDDIDNYLNIEEFEIRETLPKSKQETEQTILKIQNQRDFIDIFGDNKSDRFKLIQAYFKAKESRRDITKQDLIEICCNGPYASMTAKKFANVFARNYDFIYEGQDRVYLQQKYTEVLKRLNAAGMFEFVPEQDKQNLSLAEKSIDDLVRDYLIPALKLKQDGGVLEEYDCLNLTNYLYSRQEFGLPFALLSTGASDKQKYYEIELNGKVYNVLKHWNSAQSKNKLIAWLQNKGVI